jgi:hypothetical protein
MKHEPFSQQPRVSVTYTKKMDYGKEGVSVTVTTDVNPDESRADVIARNYKETKEQVDKVWEEEGLF